MQPDAHIDDWANRYMQWIAGTKIKIFCFSQVWFSYILFLHWKNGGTLEWYGYTSNFCYPFLENMVRALGPSSFSIIVPAELSIATKTRCNNKMNLTILCLGEIPQHIKILVVQNWFGIPCYQREILWITKWLKTCSPAVNISNYQYYQIK